MFNSGKMGNQLVFAEKLHYNTICVHTNGRETRQMKKVINGLAQDQGTVLGKGAVDYQIGSLPELLRIL